MFYHDFIGKYYPLYNAYTLQRSRGSKADFCKISRLQRKIYKISRFHFISQDFWISKTSVVSFAKCLHNFQKCVNFGLEIFDSSKNIRAFRSRSFRKIIRTFRPQKVCKCSKNARFSVSKFLNFPKTVKIREISAEKFLQYYLFPNIANFCREISEPPKFYKSWSQIFEIKKYVNVGSENCEFFENVQVWA